MATAQLMNHKGGREVTLEQLAKIDAPPPTETWFPIAHRDVLAKSVETLEGAGFQIRNARYSLAHDDHRFFGVLDLTAPITPGVSLSVGLRNSTDKSFPIGFCAGSRVFVCDNLAFHSEIVVSKKHTRFGQERYCEGIANAVSGLNQFRETQANWINRLSCFDLSEDAANSYLLQMYEKDIISTRLLPHVINEWRHPSYDEYKPRTAWSLFNAATTVLGRMRQAQKPAETALTTMRLSRLLTPEVIDVESNPIPQTAGAGA